MCTPTRSLSSSRNLSLATAEAAYLDAVRLSGGSPKTVIARTHGLRHFGRFWGERDLREVTTADLQRYMAHGAGLSRETAYQYAATVRAFFRFLAGRHEILLDPWAGLALPRLRSRPLGRILSERETAVLLKQTTVLRDRALLEFLYSTGLRAAEARRVKIEDVGDDAVVVRGGKGGRDRTVPLGARAREWVMRYARDERRAAADVPELWVSRKGLPFGEARFGQILRKLGRAAGIAGLTCHVLRRSMATHLLSAGASASAVSAILGHADLGALKRYAKAASVEVRETHRRTHPREQDA